nr:dynein regulatory complex subunit 5-like [Lepeophtheirus salmonis]
MLKLSSSIKELNLACNSLGNEGGMILLEGVKSSLTINKLDLRLTGVSKEVDLAIQELLKLNKKKSIRMSTSSSSSAATSISSTTTTKKKSPRAIFKASH